MFRLVVKSSCEKRRRTSAMYKVDESNKMPGMRVKTTWTFGGGGMHALFYHCVLFE